MITAISARGWRLMAIVVLVGGGLSFAFAMTRPEVYESKATLFYQERISTCLLQGRRLEPRDPNIAEGFREILFEPSTLARIIHAPALDPYPELDDERAIDRLRQAVRFELRGASGFRITYADRDPERAQRVTAALSALLQDIDTARRIAGADHVVEVARQQKAASSAELARRLLAFDLRGVDALREIDSALADAVYRAELDAGQARAEQDRLAVIDSASRAREPIGPSRSSVLVACLLLFIGLGLLVPGPRLLAYE